MSAVGYDLTNPISSQADDEGRGHGLGDRVRDEAGKEYVYVQANGALTSGDVVQIDEAYQASPITTTTSAGAVGDKCGVTVFTFADNEYGFVQIYGPVAAINVGSSAAANTKLNTTATAGRLDDDATAGSETILSIVTTGAESGNFAAGILSYPFIDATL